jgi:hypothetical protein
VHEDIPLRVRIKKEEKQTQGLSAESDKTNKEKLKATLHTLESTSFNGF